MDIVRHGQVIAVGHRDMELPAGEGQADVRAGLGDHDTVQVIIAALKPLGQAVLAEGAVHPENMGFSHILGFVAAQDANRKNVGGI